MPFAGDEIVPGAFWHITAPEQAELVLDDVAWPNGVGDDGATWRFCDYHRGTVTVMDHVAGRASRAHDAERRSRRLAFDDDGGMWVAQPRSHSLVRFTPDGRPSIAPSTSPAHQPASLAFGGDVLYVTTIAAAGTSARCCGSTRACPDRAHPTATI